MCIRHLIAARLLDRLIQRSFAHLGAERTGIALLAFLKQDMGDVCLNNLIGNLKLPAKFCYRCKITL